MADGTAQVVTNAPAEGDAADAAERQVVVVRAGDETYGLPIGSVWEIIRMQRVTPVPGAAGVEGILNLRGRIIPVLDLRARLGVAAAAATGETRIVVVEAGAQVVGMIVDAVTEVLRIPEAVVEDPEVVGERAPFLTGIAKLEGRLVTLLDPERLL